MECLPGKRKRKVDRGEKVFLKALPPEIRLPSARGETTFSAFPPRPQATNRIPMKSRPAQIVLEYPSLPESLGCGLFALFATCELARIYQSDFVVHPPQSVDDWVGLVFQGLLIGVVAAVLWWRALFRRRVEFSSSGVTVTRILFFNAMSSRSWSWHDVSPLELGCSFWSEDVALHEVWFYLGEKRIVCSRGTFQRQQELVSTLNAIRAHVGTAA